MALRFAREEWERRGHISARAFDRVREARCGDAEILEIIAKVVEIILTNYMNLDADRGGVPLRKPAGAARRPTLPFGKLAELRARVSQGTLARRRNGDRD